MIRERARRFHNFIRHEQVPYADLVDAETRVTDRQEALAVIAEMVRVGLTIDAERLADLARRDDWDGRIEPFVALLDDVVEDERRVYTNPRGD